MSDSLNARVARAIWGEKKVHITETGGVDVFMGRAKRFSWRTHEIDYQWVCLDRSIDDCHRHMLPALEKRGLQREFYSALFKLTQLAPGHEPRSWPEAHFAVLKLGPRQWCEAFLSAWEQKS